MNTQTIFQAGNSQVVSIPPALLAELNLKIGQKVTVDKIDDQSMVIKKVQMQKTKTFSQKAFKNWLDAVLVEDADTLKNLAER